MNRLRHTTRIARAIIALVPKLYLAYSIWFWVEFLTQILSMIIFVYFWRAVYADQTSISGLSLDQTLNYILLTTILAPVVAPRLIHNFGFMIREGMISVELLRPIDIQWRYYLEEFTSLVISLLIKAPLLLIALIFFGLQLPYDPLIWFAFFLTLFLGFTAVFFFDWIFSCLAFYTTEVWGLSVVRDGVSLFFSGVLVPLDMMPGWLQTVATAMPFAQVVYVPVSLLSGITSMQELPGLLVVQLIWIVGLGFASRLVFKFAVRKVTVQGG